MALSVEQLLRGTTQVSSLPDLYYRLDAAIDDPNSSFSAIGRIIAEDTGFCSRLLRIANSALYSFPSRIDTVERAMSIIGTKQLRELALATSVVRLFAGLENSLVSMESFWRHSLCCGAAARVIATLRRENNVERFFVLGMLHDVGRLVMYNRIPEQCRQVFAEVERSKRLAWVVEKELIGFHHGLVGYSLLALWRLPRAQIEAVGLHHNPDGARQFPLEAAVVHVADIIANALRTGTSGEPRVPALRPQAWERLEVAESQLDTILEHTQAQYTEAVRLFLDSP